MKRLLILASGLILGACATVVSYQNNCEKTTSNFEGLVACTKESILKDPRPAMQADARVKLYLLKADQLVDRVKTGRLSEVDARVDLQQSGRERHVQGRDQGEKI